MKIHQYYVCILTNKLNTVLYVGVTNDMVSLVYHHKQKLFKSFSATYNCNKLVYYEEFQWIRDAITREKQLKAGSRQKKIDLIVENNLPGDDLSNGWYDDASCRFRKKNMSGHAGDVQFAIAALCRNDIISNVIIPFQTGYSC